jgi:hypothetical protein
MDPTQALNAAEKLAAGDIKFVLAACFVGSVLIAVWLGRMLYVEMKACNAQMLDLTTKKIESDNKLASALEGLEKVVETALRAVKP